MNTKSQYQVPMCSFLPMTARMLWCALITLNGLTATLKVQAASQTWTNAPTDNAWTNILNWNLKAVPGALNSSTIADIATFTNALPLSGIGGAGNPITNDVTRGVRGFLFDTANCGAYVFGHNLSDNYLDVNSPLFSTGFDAGGNITVNSVVASPIIFNEAIRVRFPSSTNVRYDITNNAASASATLFFAAITNTSASTRPLFLYLSGSNTGTNTIARIDDQAAGSGAIQLFKEDVGRWILSGPNDLPQKTSAGNVAGVFIENGTLEVQAAGSLGAITVGNLYVTNATLQIDGVTLANAGISLRKGGVIKMNGSGTVNGVAVSALAANSVTLATTGSSDVMTIGNAVNQPTGGAADTLLHVAGPGTVLLSQSANYVGKWTLDAGTTQLGNAAGLGTGANLNIAAGATFDVSPLGAITYALGTTAISASGTGTTVGTTAATIKADAAGTVDLATGAKAISLTFTPTVFSGDTTHPSAYVSQGTLSLGGNAFTVNNASGTALGVGTYRLIQQASGSVTDGGGYAVSVTGSGKVGGTVATIQVSGGNVNLVISAYVAQSLVWTGGNPNSTWDIATDANWLNGASISVFNTSDNVTFNPVGSTNPAVTLTGTLSPGNVIVDTSANNYTFSGSGLIAGSTSLVKKSSGTLVISTVNTYSGGTVISNGVIQLGAINAIPSTGAGDVAVNSPGLLDLNGNSDIINALTGNGTVDNVTAGGAPVLTVGNNGNSGTFSGVIQNTTGTVGLTKEGNGVETLTAANTYTGTTTVNAGTLRVGNVNALGSGGSAVNVNAGTLDLATNVVIGVLGGTGGTIANNSTSTTNALMTTNSGTANAIIANGSGGGGVKVLVARGTLQLNGNNTYSGGTIVSEGAGLAFGGGAANAGAGGVTLSNNATVRQVNTGSGSSAPGNTFTTVDGAAATFSSGNTANNYGGQFVGSATATNIFANGAMSIGGTTSFANFLGTVIISNGFPRMGPNTGFMGGDNTTFIFVNGGGMFTRDAGTVRLGALFGDGGIGNPSNPFGNYWIGAKGIDCRFFGAISGSNNIVKTGAARLSLEGSPFTLNTDNATYTNRLYTAPTTYLGFTTISNGVLALSVPNNLNNSPTITLADTSAVLDAVNMGYITNFFDVNGANSALITNGVFEVLATTPAGTPQRLNGIGTIRGSLVADAGSTLNPGNTTGVITTGTATGVLDVTNAVDIEGAAVNVQLNRANPIISDKISAGSTITVNGGTLTVTNVGPDLVTGDVLALFNKGITGSGFTTISLPVQNLAATITYVYETNLVTAGSSPAGTIKVLTGASAIANYSTNITATVTGGGTGITVAWPATHLGWELMLQTNTLAAGLGNNWVTNFGTASVTSTNYPINPANGSVFYKLVHP